MNRWARSLAPLPLLWLMPQASVAEDVWQGAMRVDHAAFEPAPLRSAGDRYRLRAELTRSAAPAQEGGRFRVHVAGKLAGATEACSDASNDLFSDSFE